MRVADHLITFCCELSTMRVERMEFNSFDSPSMIENKMRSSIFTAIQNLFLEERKIAVIISF